MKSEILKKIDNQMGGWFSNAIARINIFKSYHVYRMKQQALHKLKKDIESADNLNFGTILNRWKTQALFRNTKSNYTIMNYQLLGIHRNAFFSKDRAHINTDSENFIDLLQKNYRHVILKK